MHIYIVIHTYFSSHIHTYLYNLKIQGTIGNRCIQDCTNNLRFSYLGLPYFTKQKNNQLDNTTPTHHLEGHAQMRKG
jgi:hypothetical protein